MNKAIAVDFDGTIHQYDGWSETAEGHALPGAVEALWEIHESEFDLIIFTARASEPKYRDNIIAWMLTHGFPPPVDVTNIKKPSYIVMIDDRAIPFSDWRRTVIHALDTAREDG